jgi:hypothetical protein
VKTYAHTLMLLREKLEDQGEKAKELEVAVAKKRLELLERLQHQLANIGRTDDKVDAQVASLRDLVGANVKAAGKKAVALPVVR